MLGFEDSRCTWSSITSGQMGLFLTQNKLLVVILNCYMLWSFEPYSRTSNTHGCELNMNCYWVLGWILPERLMYQDVLGWLVATSISRQLSHQWISNEISILDLGLCWVLFVLSLWGSLFQSLWAGSRFRYQQSRGPLGKWGGDAGAPHKGPGCVATVANTVLSFRLYIFPQWIWNNNSLIQF